MYHWVIVCEVMVPAGVTKPRASTQQSLYTGGMSQEITEETATTWYNHCLTLDPPVPAEWGVDRETREVIEDDIRTHLARGVGDPELYAEVILDSIDYLSDNDQDTEKLSRPTEEAINAYARQVIERHRNLAQELGITREDGNLERAFAQLAEEGILGRSNFTCCGTCGNYEIVDERDSSRTWYGYVFYHQQDAEAIPQGRGVFLGYGIFWPAHCTKEQFEAMSEEEKDEIYERLSVAMMRDKVVPVLERNGMQVDWNGDFSRRPYVHNVWAFEVPYKLV